MNAKLMLYSAVGDELTRYEVDADEARLERCETVQVPAIVQYAWPHPSRRHLYIATSNRGPGLKADLNHVSAWRIDPASGRLTLHGEPRAQYTRAVHICVDPSGHFLLSGHNLPRTGLTVNRIEDDGAIGPEVGQPAGLDYGIYPHQVMATPSGGAVILVDRGNDAADGKPEDPGALRLYRLTDGVLSALQIVAPNWGYGYGPRHLDFHPTQPWAYVSLERQNQMMMYRMAGDCFEPDAAFVRETLSDPTGERPRQLAGPIHVHPNGRFVYAVNRGDWTIDRDGERVFGGGENSVAVYAIDPVSGEPTLIQHTCTQSFNVRTFAIDPGGRMLVAASIKPLAVRDSTGIVRVPAALTVFRIGTDGRLAFVRKYDVETNGRTQYWMGMVALA